MILMTIDHVRVYSGVPAGGPTFGVFFTRWITNFVAPTFVFLAGTSAYLYGRVLARRAALSKYLVLRGIWLVLLELTILRIFWTFNFDFRHYLLAGVIWMIGCCMVALSAVVFVPNRLIGALAVAIIVLHNITNLFRPQLAHYFASTGPNALLRILYFGGVFDVGHSGPPLYILYVLVPWVGVMFAGYAFGGVVKEQPQSRRRVCFTLGIALSILFIGMRLAGLYGDPHVWDRRSLFSFLSTTKYPASLEYLLMTMGPMFLLWAFVEGKDGRFASIIETFGRVPFFFYLAHIPLIHLAACLVSVVRNGHVDPWLFANHPMAPGPEPAGYEWGLPLLYLVYAICLILLYFLCSWYARMKQTHPSVWLRFL